MYKKHPILSVRGAVRWGYQFSAMYSFRSFHVAEKKIVDKVFNLISSFQIPKCRNLSFNWTCLVNFFIFYETDQVDIETLNVFRLIIKTGAMLGPKVPLESCYKSALCSHKECLYLLQSLCYYLFMSEISAYRLRKLL